MVLVKQWLWWLLPMMSSAAAAPDLGICLTQYGQQVHRCRVIIGGGCKRGDSINTGCCHIVKNGEVIHMTYVHTVCFFEVLGVCNWVK
jgi:hypothetical protein